ncbi:hypothetical protein H9N25_06830 [Pedobacter riviphilus]|uniref:Uncharacterized protein n=1 Tax=Pedobacter riviphilus TaxID=2766984 RepID=A0ABX6TN75_9SPHI|nr:hypothetical protein [Pedobacter riviphilus]QNR86127.1 hypothetical protein H9N25_06830 [Pedobacter riviphilus]
MDIKLNDVFNHIIYFPNKYNSLLSLPKLSFAAVLVPLAFFCHRYFSELAQSPTSAISIGLSFNISIGQNHWLTRLVH